MSAATIDDVKAQLRISGTEYDAQLTNYLAAATTIVESYVGPLSVTDQSEVVASRNDYLLLSIRPVVSITSLVSTYLGIPDWTGDKLMFEPNSGVVQRTDMGTLAGEWTATYKAGNATVDPTVNLAQCLLVQDLWESMRGGTARPGTPVQPLMPGAEVTRRVELLLSPSKHTVIC